MTEEGTLIWGGGGVGCLRGCQGDWGEGSLSLEVGKPEKGRPVQVGWTEVRRMQT